mmetsp:Transcript_13415/g.36099  ORF Transcript_13415/g.36099 Transcript_13415/m.36099 type:complete len:346 (-) Transcript_13415:510-1547(-)
MHLPEVCEQELAKEYDASEARRHEKRVEVKALPQKHPDELLAEVLVDLVFKHIERYGAVPLPRVRPGFPQLRNLHQVVRHEMRVEGVLLHQCVQVDARVDAREQQLEPVRSRELLKEELVVERIRRIRVDLVPIRVDWHRLAHPHIRRGVQWHVVSGPRSELPQAVALRNAQPEEHRAPFAREERPHLETKMAAREHAFHEALYFGLICGKRHLWLKARHELLIGEATLSARVSESPPRHLQTGHDVGGIGVARWEDHDVVIRLSHDLFNLMSKDGRLDNPHGCCGAEWRLRSGRPGEGGRGRGLRRVFRGCGGRASHEIVVTIGFAQYRLILLALLHDVSSERG